MADVICWAGSFNRRPCRVGWSCFQITSHSSQSSFRLVLASHTIFGSPKLSEMTTGLTMSPCTCGKDRRPTKEQEQICYRRRTMSLARPRLWVGQSSVQNVCDTCFALATRLIYADCKFLSLNSALIYSFIFLFLSSV